jgi:hypothetical protein
MTLQFQNQTDLEEFIKQIKEQTFADLQKLRVELKYDEAAIELAIKAFNAIVVKPPNQRNNSELL